MELGSFCLRHVLFLYDTEMEGMVHLELSLELDTYELVTLWTSLLMGSSLPTAFQVSPMMS